MQTYFWSFGPLANLVSSFRESSQHVVRKTCAWINTAQMSSCECRQPILLHKHPPKAWWNLDESGVFVDYLVPENLVGWVSFIFRWFSNIFPWNIWTSQPGSLESQGMIPRGYATKHSPKVYFRICPTVRVSDYSWLIAYRLGCFHGFYHVLSPLHVWFLSCSMLNLDFGW